MGGGFAINAGQIKDQSTPACRLADFMKTEFIAPNFDRIAARVFVPSYRGAWCFLMATPPTWAKDKLITSLPHRLKYFSLERLKNNTTFDYSYATSIYSYSYPNDTEKLIAEAAALETKVFEHHGC